VESYGLAQSSMLIANCSLLIADCSLLIANSSQQGKKNRQVTYIAPLNRIPLLSSDPGGVL
jgi:hypothetical protein